MKTCSICGVGYKTKSNKEDVLIYGCRSCHKGEWIKNQKELRDIEVLCQKRVFPHGKPNNRAEMAIS